jgi:hypothetical protein
MTMPIASGFVAAQLETRTTDAHIGFLSRGSRRNAARFWARVCSPRALRDGAARRCRLRRPRRRRRAVRPFDLHRFRVAASLATRPRPAAQGVSGVWPAAPRRLAPKACVALRRARGGVSRWPW